MENVIKTQLIKSHAKDITNKKNFLYTFGNLETDHDVLRQFAMKLKMDNNNKRLILLKVIKTIFQLCL